MAGEFPLHLLILTQSGTQLPQEAAVLPWHLTAQSCPARSLEEAAYLHHQFLVTTQEAKWAAAHGLTMFPGTKGASPECGRATGGTGTPPDLTAF